MEFEIHRRHPAWTPEDIAGLPDGYAEHLVLAHAGWDEAVQAVQKREARKNAPKRPQRPRRPIYGMPGAEAPERGPGDDR